jgi:hypothetical protein
VFQSQCKVIRSKLLWQITIYYVELIYIPYKLSRSFLFLLGAFRNCSFLLVSWDLVDQEYGLAAVQPPPRSPTASIYCRCDTCVQCSHHQGSPLRLCTAHESQQPSTPSHCHCRAFHPQPFQRLLILAQSARNSFLVA